MAYISAAEVKEIRKELKETFPEYKFSVRKGVGSYSVEVNIMSGPSDFSSIFGNRGHFEINQYYLDNYGEFQGFFDKILQIIKTAPAKASGDVWYDRSDSMVDYFDIAFYIHVSVGQWNKPYQQISK